MASRSNRSARSEALSGFALGWVSVLGTALPSSLGPIIGNAWDLFEDTRTRSSPAGRSMVSTLGQRSTPRSTFPRLTVCGRTGHSRDSAAGQAEDRASAAFVPARPAAFLVRTGGG